MKRLLLFAGVIGITAIVTYLAVTRHLAEIRATGLQRALLDAEERIMNLESSLGDLEARLAELAQRRSSPAIQIPRPRPLTEALRDDETGMQRADAAGNPLQPPARNAPDSTPPTLLRFASTMKSGATNLIRIEGTSSLHDWQVQSRLIGGQAEVEPLPTEAETDDNVSNRKLHAKAQCFIPVRSLSSIQEDGSPYSTRMDEIMFEKLQANSHGRILFTLSELWIKERVDQTPNAFLCQARGQIAVAGKTNDIPLLVTISQASKTRLIFTGTVKLKMTDFGITPPSPAIAGGAIRTGDEVTIRFAWTTEQR